MDSFSRETPKSLGSGRQFRRHGQSGRYVSECLPHLGQVVDDLAFVSSVYTDNFNHAPAKIFLNTGSTRFGRPSMGAWATHGIGSESQDLPGFVVSSRATRTAGRRIELGQRFFFHGSPGGSFPEWRGSHLNLTSPKGFDSERQQQVLQTVRDLNQAHLKETGDPEVATRIASYEMASRMQTSGPELIDFSEESKETLALYGVEPGARSFANNCLLARRLVERGVRFVQLYHTDWDQHGGPGTNLNESLDQICQQIDRPCAPLIQDLKQRGLLDQTLVVWGGEFGRTPIGEQRETLAATITSTRLPCGLQEGALSRGRLWGTPMNSGSTPLRTRFMSTTFRPRSFICWASTILN